MLVRQKNMLYIKAEDDLKYDTRCKYDILYVLLISIIIVFKDNKNIHMHTCTLAIQNFS